MPIPWYCSAYRRNVVDMHITADDARFLSEFDPQAYVSMLTKARVQSTVLYAQSHTGLCYFPTMVGKMHPGIQGRDILGEVIELCHKAGIHVVVYFSLIFDLWAYREHPDWKIYDAKGQPAADASRYGVCCPNSPYREYIREIVTELCTGYDFEGIRFDMTFWPRVCYCRHCQARFAAEVGGDLPRIIDWNDSRWVAFQRARERWLVEFARLATNTVRGIKPAASVEHQASTYALTWRMGVTTGLAHCCDFLEGDFYGDALQGSFSRKLLGGLSLNRPAGFETSISTDLTNPTSLKSEDLLTCKAAAALADGAAFIMIDSIDPAGTLNPLVYKREGRVFERIQPYQPFLGGSPVHDVAIYFSTESKFDPSDNGKEVDDPSGSPKMPHVEAVLGACKTLLDNHIPFGVITRSNLGELARYPLVILPNILMMDAEEAGALRAYVREGGCLYASRYTSLQTPDGHPQVDFLLADVFGASYQGETKEGFTYIAPVPGQEGFFGDYTQKHPVGICASQALLQAHPGAEILGTLVLPYTDPADPTCFASTHNNPPGCWTGSPALVHNHFGRGRCIFAAIDLESADNARQIFASLVQHLAGPFTFESDAPKTVELTAFHQPENSRIILNLINFQRDLPNIPVDSVSIRLRMKGNAAQKVLLLPGGEPLAFRAQHGVVEFSTPRLETFLMLAVVYQV